MLEYAFLVNILLSFPLFSPGQTIDFPARPSERQLLVEWNVPVTPSGGAHLNWFEMKADPANKNNLIVCGATRSAQNNAYYGIVYWSHDGGRSWGKGILDCGSSWVSEQSCAFGPRHTAYFVSAASKVIDDVPHHNLGRTHIFVSRDAGVTWVKTAETGWADYSNSVVVKKSGGRQPQLYVFYNSAPKKSGAKNSGSSLGFFVVSEDGRKISHRQTVPGMAQKGYMAVYPSSSETLDDGTTAILYNAARRRVAANGRTAVEIGVVRLTSHGISKPVVIAYPVYKFHPPACPPSLSNSLAYDKIHHLLYAAYNTALSGHCAVMLASSPDEGKTWSRPHELSDPAVLNRSMYFPTLAVNDGGIIGLLWRGNPNGSPDCWFFSTSSDGIRLDHTVSLSHCGEDDSLNGQFSAYLATVVHQPASGQSVSVRLVTLRDYLTRVGFVATPEGVFHPLWSAREAGNSELRTARIWADKRPRSCRPTSIRCQHWKM
ncbi:MAG: sialidase family protein [Candidatus Acidiferrales bacterium]